MNPLYPSGLTLESVSAITTALPFEHETPDQRHRRFKQAARTSARALWHDLIACRETALDQAEADAMHQLVNLTAHISHELTDRTPEVHASCDLEALKS